MRPRLVASALLVLLLGVPATSQGQDAAPWTEGPIGDDGLPEAQGRHMRILISVDLPSGLAGARDLPITHTFDLAAVLAGMAGYPADSSGRLDGFELDLGSIVLVEVDHDGHPVDEGERLPVQVLPGGGSAANPFHPRDNPTVTLQWVMTGQTHAMRWFYIYFDALHNGVKTDTSGDGNVAAVGPGRGTKIYVPLPRHDAPGEADPRLVRITNLQPTPTAVTITQYDVSGTLLPGTKAHLTLPPGIGATHTIAYPDGYRHGALLVEARGTDGKVTGLITAEAVSRGLSSQFAPGSSTLFLPSAQGGFVGAAFSETPVQNVVWYVYCPAHPVEAMDCQITLTHGGPTRTATLQPNTHTMLNVASGTPAVLTSQGGDVAVQRVMGDPNAASHGLTLWPPMDGPRTAAHFMGHALNADESGNTGRNTADHLVMVGRQAGVELFVQEMVGSGTILSDGMRLDANLFTDQQIPSWGTRWDRAWRHESNPQATFKHQDGPVLLRDLGGAGGLTVVSGHLGKSDVAISSASALVPLQSPDGGLRHEFFLPPAPTGAGPLGSLVLFTPYAGTSVVATGKSLDGASPLSSPGKLGPYQQDQFVDLGRKISDPGLWTLTSDRPIVAAWLKAGAMPLAGVGLAVTQGAIIEVLDAQASGHLLRLDMDSLQNAVPGKSARIDGVITNLGRTTTGEGIQDGVRLHVETPAGWGAASIFPSDEIVLDEAGTADASQAFTVTVTVPANVDTSTGGATLRIVAQSMGEPRLVLKSDVFLNYKLERGVQVTADGETVSLKKLVDEDGNVTYLVQIINTGSVAEAFDVTLSMPEPAWRMEVECFGDGWTCPTVQQNALLGRTPTLAAHGSASMQLTVGPRPDESPFRLITFVLASSASLVDGIKLETAVASDRLFRAEVETPTRFVEPGQATTFDVWLFNDAEVVEELVIDVGGFLPTGWPEPEIVVHIDGKDEPVALENLTYKVGVEALSSTRISVTQAVPHGAAPATMGLDLLSLYSSLDPSAAAIDVDMRVIAKEVRGLDASTSREVLSVAPGTTTETDLILTSLGNTVQDIRVHAEVHGTKADAWVVQDANATSPPWDVRLAPGQERRLPVVVKAPAGMPPGDGAGLVLRLTASGLEEKRVAIDLDVAERAAADVPPTDIHLPRSTPHRVDLPVSNTGNVPLDVHLEWEGIPSSWWQSDPPVHVLLGATTGATTTFTVPGDAAQETMSTVLHVMHEGRQVAQVPVSLHINAPRLEAEVVGDPTAHGDKIVYQVAVKNTGFGPAYDVHVRLVEGGRGVDEITIDQILPGRTAVANIIGSTGGATIHVNASHDREGVQLQVRGPEEEKRIPGPAAGAVVAALAAHLLRRRRVEP